MTVRQHPPQLNAALHTIQLDVQGMTCASCAARIEKKLNRMDGVSATVNYATEKATVHAAAGTTSVELIATIEKTGYGATLPAETRRDLDADVRNLRHRVIITAVLSLPVIIMAMVPVLQFPGWQWISFALTIPVVTWGAWLFHRATLVNLWHGNATMDTLISIGTLAATGWSAYALAFGTAGEIGFTHRLRVPPRPAWGDRQHLSRSRRRHHHLHPARPLPGGAGEAAFRRCPAGPPRAHPGRGHRRPRRHRVQHRDRGPAGR